MQIPVAVTKSSDLCCCISQAIPHRFHGGKRNPLSSRKDAVNASYKSCMFPNGRLRLFQSSPIIADSGRRGANGFPLLRLAHAQSSKGTSSGLEPRTKPKLDEQNDPSNGYNESCTKERIDPFKLCARSYAVPRKLCRTSDEALPMNFFLTLQDIAEMSADFRKKLSTTESQLSSVVRSRLDGVKRARDLIEDNANQISKLHGQFAKMEE